MDDFHNDDDASHFAEKTASSRASHIHWDAIHQLMLAPPGERNIEQLGLLLSPFVEMEIRGWGKTARPDRLPFAAMVDTDACRSKAWEVVQDIIMTADYKGKAAGLFGTAIKNKLSNLRRDEGNDTKKVLKFSQSQQGEDGHPNHDKGNLKFTLPALRTLIMSLSREGKLSDAQTRVLWHFASSHGQYTYAESAAQLDITPDSYRQSLHRARAVLRAMPQPKETLLHIMDAMANGLIEHDAALAPTVHAATADATARLR